MHKHVQHFVLNAVFGVAGQLPTAAEALPTFSPRSVGRVAIESVGSIYWPDFSSQAAEKSIMKLLLALKAALQGSRCLFVIPLAKLL